MKSAVHNAWYALAWGDEISTSAVRRVVLDRPLVSFRSQDGRVVALEDRCPHRMAPLSRGLVRDDTIACAYHGLRFNGAGQCVGAPGYGDIPASFRVPAFATRELDGLVWIWMGDPADADDAIPTVAEADRPGWTQARGGALAYGCHYLSLIENLCDPSHVSYLHPTTLGDEHGQGAPVHVEASERQVVVSRWIENVPAVPSLAPYVAPGPVDRWQYYNFHAPSTTIVDFGTAPTGLVGPDKDRDFGVRVFIAHCVTPVDDSRCIDHWYSVRNFGAEDSAVTKALHEGFMVAYQEDKAMLEAIQLEEARDPEFKRILIKSDAGPLRMRRIISTMT
ncbi:aromatic ring-hydroxylating dioxygenase subunit alpha [soil metagenome]